MYAHHPKNKFLYTSDVLDNDIQCCVMMFKKEKKTVYGESLCFHRSESSKRPLQPAMHMNVIVLLIQIDEGFLQSHCTDDYILILETSCCSASLLGKDPSSVH